MPLFARICPFQTQTTRFFVCYRVPFYLWTVLNYLPTHTITFLVISQDFAFDDQDIFPVYFHFPKKQKELAKWNVWTEQKREAKRGRTALLSQYKSTCPICYVFQRIQRGCLKPVRLWLKLPHSVSEKTDSVSSKFSSRITMKEVRNSDQTYGHRTILKAMLLEKNSTLTSVHRMAQHVNQRSFLATFIRVYHRGRGGEEEGEREGFLGI